MLQFSSSLSNIFEKVFAKILNKVSTIINNNTLLSIERSKKRNNNNNNRDLFRTRLTTKDKITFICICCNNKKLYILRMQKRTKF